MSGTWLRLASRFVIATVVGCLLWNGLELSLMAQETPAHGLDQETSTAPLSEHGSLGSELKVWTVAPFVTLLLCIAVLPLAKPHWWEHN